nr:hypothetical protein [Cyanidioschyzonaceae sp. 1]UNJ15460.1 hypothetical protein [Cyanidioschyzonaceae sp. 1]
MKLLHTIQEIVYLEHTDAAGIIYFASLQSFAHRAFEHFVSSKGFKFHRFVQRFAFPIVHVQAEYYLPCFVGDVLTISLYLQSRSLHSLRFHYRILKHHHLVASISMKHVLK